MQVWQSIVAAAALAAVCVVAGAGLEDEDIRGLDADANGIRDDVDAWIAGQRFSAPQRLAAQQLARALQATFLLDPGNARAVLDAAEAAKQGVKCVIARRTTSAAGYRTVLDIEAITANSAPRKRAYRAYNAKLNGTVSRSPEGDGCEV